MSLETSETPSAAPSANVATESSSSALLMKTESEFPISAPSLSIPTGSPLAGLPVQLDVTVPIPNFRVHNLLSLEKGTVLESTWSHVEGVPVWCGGVQLVWAEFEVVDQKLAVRVTRIG